MPKQINLLKTNKNKYLSFYHAKFIIIILVLSFYPFFKSGISGVFVPPDAGSGLDMFKRFIHYTYTWDGLSSVGGEDSTAWRLR
ncbi:MAG: hypothetical protein B6D55_05270 [Candidatus Omnitrophica bacterium 4484_70.2]|nr:MAG: hypothetical protein B6D55_05270 [Candidatus Omnitrophica bacterium 4484_70.2]